MPINASSLLVGTERRRARRTYVATLHAKIPTSIQLTGFAIEVDPSPIWNWPHVRFGSKADMCSAKRHVRFTPESDAECVIRKSASSLGLFGAPLSIDRTNSAMLRSRRAEARLHRGRP
jgi:hypothetical protein